MGKRGRKPSPVHIRFWKYVRLSPGCWEWTGTTNDQGYGLIKMCDRRNHRAHRVAYEFAYGPVPEGLVIHHVCMNKSCVRPTHLRAVTQLENICMEDGMLGKFGKAPRLGNIGEPQKEIEFEPFPATVPVTEPAATPVEEPVPAGA